MKNKGFSIIECVLCMFLLSSVTVGIVSIILNIHVNYNDRLYKSALYTNYHTIYNVCGLSSDPLESLKEVYKELITTVDENSVVIKINLSKKHQNVDNLQYQVSITKTETEQIVNIQVINVIERYEDVNHEAISQRIYPI